MAIKLGVAGAGAMGNNHARVLAALPTVELVGVYDADFERAKGVAAAHGSRAFESADELADHCQGVAVAVPTEAHCRVGGLFLERGCHVLVEKPIAPSVEEAKALVEAAKRAGKVLQVGHIERFNPVMRSLEQKLDCAKFIEAHRLSPFPNRSMDIGVVLDLMIHDLEIILHLVRSPIKHIDAVGVPVLTKNEDIANARIRFENGCVANVTASRISPERLRKIRVFQGDCYLSLDYQAQSGEIYWREGMAIQREEVEVEKDEPLRLELEAFAKAVETGMHPTVSGEQGMAALDVALEITRLIKEGDL